MSRIVDERIDAAQIAEFRDAYERQCMRGSPSTTTTFNYAHALIGSRNKQEVTEGVGILEALLKEDSSENRDYIFYLAIANARLKEYGRALAYVDVLLGAEHGNRQARELRDAIETRMRRDGLLGAAIIGGGLIAIGAIVVAAFRR